MRGRRGTLCHRWSPCVARVGPGDIDFAFLWFSQSVLPSCSAPFSRGSASVLLSPSGAPFCPLSCPSPSKRTFLARLLFICLAVLSLSGTPFCPLSGPNPSKRTAPASTLGLLACAPCSVGWSVLASYCSRPNPSKRTSPALPRIITSMFLYTHRHGNLITRELAVGLFSFLSLVVHFVR